MEISFKDILRIIKKNIIIILAVSLIFSVGSFLVTKLFIKKSYTATVKLYVSVEYNGKSGTEELSIYNYTSKLVATYIQLLDTNNFFNAVSESLNGKYTPAELKNMITFTSIDDTEVFKADIVYSDPVETKVIADAVSKTAPVTMDSLLQNNSKLKIVDEAIMPKEPTAPNVPRNVLFAFFVGLIASLLVVFIRDYFDVKIKYSEDMTTLGGYPVLSAIPDFEYYSNNLKNQRHTGNKEVNNS